MATGSTARAACSVARAQGVGYVVMAVPVASGRAVAQLGEVSDAVVALEQPEPFYAVGQWYHRFDQTSDADVVALLARARGHDSQPCRTTAFAKSGVEGRTLFERPGSPFWPRSRRRASSIRPVLSDSGLHGAVTLRPVRWVFIVFGLFWGAWAVAAIDIEHSLGLSIGGYGLLLSISLAGSAAANAVGGGLCQRFGTSRVLAIALATWSVSSWPVCCPSPGRARRGHRVHRR